MHVAMQAWALAWERAACVGNRRVSGNLVHQCPQKVKETTVPEALTASDTGAGSGELPSDMAATDPGADDGVVACRPVFLLSRSREWYSPFEVLDRVRRLFGSRAIDLHLFVGWCEHMRGCGQGRPVGRPSMVGQRVHKSTF
jgi:hypothetical protein